MHYRQYIICLFLSCISFCVSAQFKAAAHSKSDKTDFDGKNKQTNVYNAYASNRKKFKAYIIFFTMRYGISAKLIHKIIYTEGHYQPTEKFDVGAIGLMQLLPSAAAQFGIPPLTDPYKNIEAGTRYLIQLMQRFKNNIVWVIASYHAGEGAAKRYGNQVPPFAETQDYVIRRLSIYHGRENPLG